MCEKNIEYDNKIINMKSKGWIIDSTLYIEFFHAPYTTGKFNFIFQKVLCSVKQGLK